ncbi:MAG: SsrA-binding protein SmpB [Candidatus Krumholzibacteria bacterium]|jgi:SsrA-binding protein|nr:SsrA-binding protein SmpB [Candidatus Krumholzibacteria bacterium]MDY0109780.1 SsrA-binding protein SmpB [Candidatus Krumholzibacteria bacterium]
MTARKTPPGIKLIGQNRKARHEYEILQTLEAGIVLVGTEVKALRSGRVNLGDSFAEIKGGEIWLVKLHIGPYDMGNRMNHEPFRPRKLLLSRREIRKLEPRLAEGGKTLIPLKIYFKHGLVKVEIALARGKKLYDKRDDKAKRDAERQMAKITGRRG